MSAHGTAPHRKRTGKPQASRGQRTRVIPVANPEQAQWTVPALLRLGLYGVALASLLFMIAVISGAHRYSGNLETIGQSAAPEILNAEQILAALWGMDANATRELLSRTDRDAEVAFERDRQAASDAIVAAVRSVSQAETDREPARKLASGLLRYTAAIQQARDFAALSDKRAPQAFRDAVQIMDKDLLPAANDLDQKNRAVLEESYRAHLNDASMSSSLLNGSALLLGGILVWLQFSIARRFRRMVNPLLLTATGVALLFCLYAIHSFDEGTQVLRTARSDAFEHVQGLWRLRAEAAQLDSSEGHVLLGIDAPSGGGRAEQAADAFARDSGAVPEAKGFETALQRVQHMNGAARQNAIAFFDSEAPEGFAAALNGLDAALQRSIEAQQTSFENSISAGLRDVSGFDYAAPLTALIVFGCAFLGVLPRLREYTA